MAYYNAETEKGVTEVESTKLCNLVVYTGDWHYTQVFFLSVAV
jgi:hypothetical protein